MTIAYIDAQNVYLALLSLGYEIDWEKFFHYLCKKFGTLEVKYFTGYIPQNQKAYDKLTEIWYTLNFKTTTEIEGKIKWNVDSMMVLEAVKDCYDWNCNEAIIVTNDGDFDVLIWFLEERGCLARVVCPNLKKASVLLKKITPQKKLLDLALLVNIITKNS